MTRLGAIIIGDELLSGRRQDRHFDHLIAVLAKRGLELTWCIYLRDDVDIIADALKHSLGGNDIVLCFGGIGATPDDCTRQAAAQAAGVDLYRHPQAVAEIEARFGAAAYPHRILMAELPRTSTLIPNPHNRIPGFSLGHHHFLPGFPEMAWPMLDWVLTTHYPALRDQAPAAQGSITIFGAHESQLLEIMRACLSRHPGLRLSSLPHLGPDQPRIELGVRGQPDQVQEALGELQRAITDLGYGWSPRGGDPDS